MRKQLLMGRADRRRDACATLAKNQRLSFECIIEPDAQILSFKVTLRLTTMKSGNGVSGGK